jgi:hypothetical protein
MSTLTDVTNGKAFSHPARPDSIPVLYDGPSATCGCRSHSGSRHSRSTVPERTVFAAGLTLYELSN